MKLTIALGLLVLAIGAQAQQSTTSTKKAKAATNATTIKAATETTAPAVLPAPLTGASIATLPAAAPAKKWGITLVNETSADNGQVRTSEEMTLGSVNYAGASYKITDTNKVGLRQYMSYEFDSSKTTNTKQSFTVATFSTKTKGILGSDAIAPQFWYYIPNATAEATNYGKDLEHFYGQLRLDAEIQWTLNPKWAVSYYLNPRQSFGAKESFINENTNRAASFEATSRLIHYATAYYTINDNIQTYANAGFDHRMSSERETSTGDAYISAIGAGFTFLGGKLAFYPEISATTALKSGGVTIDAPKFYRKEQLTYTLATVIAL